MNKSLPAAEHYDTFDRSSAHGSANGVQGMNSFYTYSTADCGHLAGEQPALEAYLQRCPFGDMLGYGCLGQYLANAKPDGAHRFQQFINLLVFGIELAFFVFRKQD